MNNYASFAYQKEKKIYIYVIMCESVKDCNEIIFWLNKKERDSATMPIQTIYLKYLLVKFPAHIVIHA